jgi:hypothetical protein
MFYLKSGYQSEGDVFCRRRHGVIIGNPEWIRSPEGYLRILAQIVGKGEKIFGRYKPTQ